MPRDKYYSLFRSDADIYLFFSKSVMKTDRTRQFNKEKITHYPKRISISAFLCCTFPTATDAKLSFISNFLLKIEIIDILLRSNKCLFTFEKLSFFYFQRSLWSF